MHPMPQMMIFIREHELKRHGFSAITVVYPSRCLFMDVDYLSFGDIGDSVTLSHDVMRPIQVFQTGEGLIVTVSFPKRTTDGGIGIITEGVRLVRLRRVSGYQ